MGQLYKIHATDVETASGSLCLAVGKQSAAAQLTSPEMVESLQVKTESAWLGFSVHRKAAYEQKV